MLVKANQFKGAIAAKVNNAILTLAEWQAFELVAAANGQFNLCCAGHAQLIRAGLNRVNKEFELFFY